MAAADVGDRGPVALGRLDGTQRGPHDRLRHERGDRGRPGVGDGPVQLVRELPRIAERLGSRIPGPVRVGGRDVPEPPEPPLVRAAERPASREVQRPERVAVVAAPAREDGQPVRLAPGDLRATGQLERALDRLRPAAHRVDVRLVDREVRAELRGIPLQWLVRERGSVRVREARGLVRDRLGDLTAAVAHVDDDRATGGVEVLAAVRVDDGGAVRGDGDGRLRDRRAAEDVPAHARAGVVWVLTRRL